ncbi:MAG: TIGR02300 family protein [Pseudomonadota bacterium]
MATIDARGMKRTCQSPECGERFYDLNRDPIICPICGTIYEIAHAPEGAAVVIKEEKPKKAEPVAGSEDEAEAADELEGAEAIDDIETDDDDSADDSDTFLETEEEDGGNVTDIIAPRKGGEDES